MKVLGPKQSKGTTREDLKQSVSDKTTHKLLRELAGQINTKTTKEPKKTTKARIKDGDGVTLVVNDLVIQITRK